MGRRLYALFLDYCLILGWLCLLGIVAFSLQLAGFSLWNWSVDLVAFIASVLPVWLYLTVMESGAAHATWGKRRARLHVVTTAQEPVPPVQVAVRNAVKLLPWQLAHLGVVPLIAASGTSSLVSAANAWIPIASAYLLAGLTLALMFIRHDRAALHDLIAGTRVLANQRPGAVREL